MKTLSGNINRIIKPIGFEIRRVNKNSLYEHTMYGAIQRSSKFHNINPATIIDVGAAEGKWTLQALKVWNSSVYVLFEPLQERENALSALKKKYKNIQIVNKAAGNFKKEIDFYVTEDLDGSGFSENGTNASLRKIHTTSIDEEIKNLNLKGPYLIKLDTHGYEIPILEGAKETLKDTKLLIIECYGFQIGPNSLLFWEMCNYLKDFKFRLIDIVDVSIRKKDGAFWQCDAFFISEDSKCFESNTFI